MPHKAGSRGERGIDFDGVVLVLENCQQDLFGMFRVNRKVDAAVTNRGAEWPGIARLKVKSSRNHNLHSEASGNGDIDRFGAALPRTILPSPSRAAGWWRIDVRRTALALRYDRQRRRAQMIDTNPTIRAARTHSLEMADHGRIRIEQVEPEIDGGRYPIKREVGDAIAVTADIFRDGHEKIAAWVFFKPWYRPDWESVPMVFVDNDRWAGTFTVHENTKYDYTIAAAPGPLSKLARRDRQEIRGRARSSRRAGGGAPAPAGRTPVETDHGHARYKTSGMSQRSQSRSPKQCSC